MPTVSPHTRLGVPVRRRAGRIAGVLAGIAVAIALVLAFAPAMRVPTDVAALTIDNPTVYQVNVDVTGAGGGGWLDLGSVGRERTKTVEQIADQGANWVFRFSYGGVDAGRLAVTRADLKAAGWKITVPAAASGRLQAAGLQPSAF